jgi:hypothetical protein
MGNIQSDDSGQGKTNLTGINNCHDAEYLALDKLPYPTPDGSRACIKLCGQCLAALPSVVPKQSDQLLI